MFWWIWLNVVLLIVVRWWWIELLLNVYCIEMLFIFCIYFSCRCLVFCFIVCGGCLWWVVVVVVFCWLKCCVVNCFSICSVFFVVWLCCLDCFVVNSVWVIGSRFLVVFGWCWFGLVGVVYWCVDSYLWIGWIVLVWKLGGLLFGYM